MKARSLAWSLSLAGCFGGPLDREPRAEVRSASISPTIIAAGQTFELSWDIVHSGAPGNTMFFSLSGTGSDGQVKRVLHRGDGLSRGRSRGTQSCVYSAGGQISCSPFGTGGPFAPGPVKLTFEACDSYVFDEDGDCDQKVLDVVLGG